MYEDIQNELLSMHSHFSCIKPIKFDFENKCILFDINGMIHSFESILLAIEYIENIKL